jgi:hypothetical protein
MGWFSKKSPSAGRVPAPEIPQDPAPATAESSNGDQEELFDDHYWEQVARGRPDKRWEPWNRYTR